MDSNILKKLILKQPVIDKELENELFEMCDRVHAICDIGCIMYADGYVDKEAPDCQYFKNGAKMLKAIRERESRKA